MNIQVAMLTGDSKEVAKAVADELGIELYFAEVLPEHKDQKVIDCRSKARKWRWSVMGLMMHLRLRVRTWALPWQWHRCGHRIGRHYSR